MCAEHTWSRCEGTHAWAMDRWVEVWVWQMNLGHSVLSLGQFGPLGLRGLLPSAPFGPEQGQPPLSLTPSSPDLTLPALFSLARSSTTTWTPMSQSPRKPDGVARTSMTTKGRLTMCSPTTTGNAGRTPATASLAIRWPSSPTGRLARSPMLGARMTLSWGGWMPWRRRGGSSGKSSSTT